MSFGVPRAHVHVIEFQKRGLPHCHMLIILRGEDKLRNREDIDRIISAEIPDPEEDLELYNLVCSCMIHGPCGVQNPNSVCMENGECKKRFPKPFRDETVENVNGYPAYRRRNQERRGGSLVHQVNSHRIFTKLVSEGSPGASVTLECGWMKSPGERFAGLSDTAG